VVGVAAGVSGAGAGVAGAGVAAGAAAGGVVAGTTVGATAGSILGCYFGPGHLEERWLKPFNDDIHAALAWFFERSLSKLAKRMGKLPELISGPLEKLKTQPS
jgi:hypothetical protein